MVRILRPLAFFLLSMLLPSAVSGQSARIGVYKQDGTPACSLSPGSIYGLNIKLTATAGPVMTARFKLVPSCPGATILYGALEYNLALPCAEAGATMATIVVLTPATCGGWGFYFDIVPATGDSRIVMTDCDGFAMTGADAIHGIDYSPCDVDDHVIAPYRPTPADGATDVPLNTMLSFVGPANTIQFSNQPLPNQFDAAILCGVSYCFPSVPNLPACPSPANPGMLAPNTRYYWRALTYYPTHWWCDASASEIFTFTTGSLPLATEPATWGHIKSMYR